LKLQLKRLGGEEFKEENRELIRQGTPNWRLDSANKDDKKNPASTKTKPHRCASCQNDAILKAIGGQLTKKMPDALSEKALRLAEMI
jgi:type I restriction enzyme M protein